MTQVAVLGAQWGDEGKGKIVDLLSSFADVIVRFQGGGNAGHTLLVDGNKTILNYTPSGVLHENKTCILAQGMVIDPWVLREEHEMLEKSGHLESNDIRISNRAHIILPHHRDADSLREDASDGSGIGTTRKGIGPAYEDKAGRRGIRVGDLFDSVRLRELVKRNVAHWRVFFEAAGVPAPDEEDLCSRLEEISKTLEPMVADTSRLLGDFIKENRSILFEGAQGTLLDIDHGTFPYVTSSNTVAGGICTGCGVGPREINTVVGVSKAYTTRVGGGPFPTEALGETGEWLRERGGEYGATTGRPRRCGWLDIASLRRSVRINGIESLVITKLDILSGLEKIPVCTAYMHRGKRLDEPNLDALDEIQPVYEYIEGWQEELESVRKPEDLPEKAAAYIRRIEDLLECPVGVISVGPSREQTMILNNPFTD